MARAVVIAIDGPAGAGKSTVARRVADRLGSTYLDSGAMYRCVALAAIERGADPDDADALGSLATSLEIELEAGRVKLDGRDVTAEIRAPAVSAAASRVSAHRAVREAMVARQREILSDGAASYVAEGRDIGTVVCPEAPLKVFLTADDSERARRRAAELGEERERVLAEVRERDRRDAERSNAPLRAAEDAVLLDTTTLGIDEVVDRIVGLARERGLG